MLWLLLLIPIVAIAFLAWRLVAGGGPRLDGAAKRKILAQWSGVLQRTDAHRKVIEADAVIALLLRELGYQGSMGDGLKKGGKYLPQLQSVWEAHKLRNRLAHEPGVQPTPREVDRAVGAFARVIDKFCA